MKRILSVAFAMCLAFSLATMASAATPQHEDGYLWNKATVIAYVDQSIITTWGTGTRNAICNGLKAWNVTDAPTVDTSADQYTLWDVYVMMNDYGATGWDGICTAYHDGNAVTEYAIIKLNSGGIDDKYEGDTDLWKAIACHEMGHAHGLGHNTEDTYSIMKPSTKSFYDYTSSFPNMTIPQTVDRTAINALY